MAGAEASRVDRLRLGRKRSDVHSSFSLPVLATVFGLVFLGELPDKTMFASLVLAARGHRGLVWLGAAAAFLAHVVIAVTLGGVLFTLLPERVVETVVALLFLGGAVWALRTRDGDDHEAPEDGRHFGGFHTAVTAFVVIFIAEWGDLTQILTANLAARYHDPIGVGVAATAALWAVAGIAMFAGKLLARLPMLVVRRVTGIVLLLLAALSAYSAITGKATIV
jgi:putative Ca2+/H+ antiporter (TMEM165/GDT1 family)